MKIITFDSFVPDGLGPYLPDANPSFRWSWGEDVTFRGRLRHSDNTPFNLTGPYALVLTFKKSIDDDAPLVARQQTVIDFANGIYEFYVTNSDRALLVPGAYSADVTFIDSSGIRALEYTVILPSRSEVFRTNYRAGQLISVPSFQQPLAQGPVGPAGAQGPPGPAPTPPANVGSFLVVIRNGVLRTQQCETVIVNFANAAQAVAVWPDFQARPFTIEAAAPVTDSLDQVEVDVIRTGPSAPTSTGCTLQANIPFTGTVTVTAKEVLS